MDEGQPPKTGEVKSSQDQLDERRLALEFERLRFERQKTGIELRLKRRELAVAPKKRWVDLLSNPLTLAIVGGFLTLMTTTVASHFSTSESINAEAAKARQALQADLIKKFVENPNPQAVRANLRFLVDVGLVPNYADNLRSFLDKNPDSALPSSFTLGASGLQNVNTEDDAIDLVLRFAGGYVDSSAFPDNPSNFGLTLATLSGYLGRSASKDDLRNLSVATARDIYRQVYLKGGSGLASVHVKAAYLNLATNTGPVQAAKIFQAAANKLGMSPPSPEGGSLGPLTLTFINAADPDLFIETANCEAVKFYKSFGANYFAEFGAGWIRALRTFSPLTLRGICPELLPSSNPSDASSAKP
jgi:lysozyme family protein